MDLAERIERRERQRVDLGGVRDVGRHADRIGAGRAQCFDGLRKRFAVDVGQHQLHAKRCAFFGKRTPKAARRAGDHSHFAFELEHRVSPLVICCEG